MRGQKKLPLIEAAAANFLDHAADEPCARYRKFCLDNSSWLSDYCIFKALHRRHGYRAWHNWPSEHALRKHEPLAAVMQEHKRDIDIEQVVQFFFSEQWAALRSYCAQRDIKIMGDVAIFVSMDSADVWINPGIFDLDENRRPTRVSGVPPDYFSSTGQRWGNPLYNWAALQEREFDWWVARIRRALALYDVIRLDHFRGFEAFWSIPAEEPTAINGQWVKALGHELFKRLKDIFGELPFVAEDLGVITPEVDELRERFGMPGMRILQFGFIDRGAHLYLPHRFVPNTVVYTGTHDNNTTLGWWRENTNSGERTNAQTYLEPIDHDAQIVWAMMRAAARSVANLCIFPMQDVLHLGSEARMNTPSNCDGNWGWRYTADALHPDFVTQLAALTELTDRDGFEKAQEGIDAGKPTDEAHTRIDLGSSV